MGEDPWCLRGSDSRGPATGWPSYLWSNGTSADHQGVLRARLWAGAGDTGLLPQCGSHLAKEAKKDTCPWDKDLKGNKPARTSRLEQVPGPGALTD